MTVGIAKCLAGQLASQQLDWLTKSLTDSPVRVPAQTDTLRRWTGCLIDAAIDFHDDVARLPGQHALHWRHQLVLVTEERLRTITGPLSVLRWLVHARHRTQIRGAAPTLDRQLYRTWLPHLIAAVCDLISYSAAAAAQATLSGQEPATAAHLLQAHHTLQHACLRLNQRDSTSGYTRAVPLA
ncbi:hypothetical protein [Streptomyces sp. NBC_00233]|uniref:hypothetical protein n=1 Tax=Streptomyces sp. NBC_00233 TaxID=2975686 RepID=UPI0022575434|nr:hypothetical protein [Streptomyces sp. NBC_00233]MCX5233401.1 hypothetical protein [Streptomyces sp. NBC_00233]